MLNRHVLDIELTFIRHQGAQSFGYSYTGQYVEENPTIDRYRERVEKLMEDVYSKTIKPYGDRHPFVHFSW